MVAMKTILAVALVACSLYSAAAVTVVGSGFNWAENLRCDAETQSLFVSEYDRGELYKITGNAQGGFNQTLHVSTMYKKFAGLAINEATGVLYAITETTAGDCYIVSVDKEVPESTTPVAKLPKLGNGLAIDQTTGNLWATAEGDFVPLLGAVYEIDPSTGVVTPRITGSFANDGAYMNQATGELITSEVLISKVVTYDTRTNKISNEHRAPDAMGMLDDFCLNANGTLLYGADYEHGKVDVFGVDAGSDATVLTLISGLNNPTSARWGCGGAFPTSSLFVTEGGNLLGNPPNRLVLELPNVRP